MKYSKPSITIKEQIDLLKKRGLIVNDKKDLSKYLSNISYYHLSSYFKHFQKNDHFYDRVTFDDILNIYVFDQKLRLLLLDVLERIEKSFKCRLVYELATKYNDSHWLSDEKYFEDKENYYKRTVAGILDKLPCSKETYIKHYYQKYSEPQHPPTWTIIDSLTFGQSVMIYGQLTKENKKLIAQTYDLNKKHVQNWMYALSIIRNFCAHHSRLWNKNMIITLNKRVGIYKDLFSNSHRNRLWNYIVIIQIINCKFNPDSKWTERLYNIIQEHNINVSHMDFPEDWMDRLQEIREIEIIK